MALKVDDSPDDKKAGENAKESIGLRVLKVLVVVMGIMIVVGVAVIVATIVSRLSESAVDAPPSLPTGALQRFEDTQITIPSGYHVRDMQVDGNRLILRLESESNPVKVLVVDLSTGQRLGALELVPNSKP